MHSHHDLKMRVRKHERVEDHVLINFAGEVLLIRKDRIHVWGRRTGLVLVSLRVELEALLELRLFSSRSRRR